MSPQNGHIYLDDGNNTATGLPAFRARISGAWVDLDTDTAGGGGGAAVVNRLYHSLTHPLWQEGTTFNDVADDTYVADVWTFLHNGQAPDVSQQVDATDNNAYLRITFDSAASRAGIVQFLETKDSKPLSNKFLSLSLAAWGSGVSNIRAAIISWGGTADALTSDVVGTWADPPILATNWIYLGLTGAIAITGTKTRYTISENVSVGTATNLGVFIWTPDEEGSTDVLNIADVQLEIGEVVTEFVPRSIGDELRLVQRYLTQLNQDGGAFTRYAFGRVQSTTQATLVAFLPETMRTAPTFSVSAVSDFKTTNLGTSVSTLVLNTGTTKAQSLAITVASGLTANDAIELYSDVSTAFMQFDARL